jgi:hypothetical protein
MCVSFKQFHSWSISAGLAVYEAIKSLDTCGLV